FRVDDLSFSNQIATGLFGDGAAAVLVLGAAQHGAGPRVLGTRSMIYPGTERLMGWEVVEGGFKLVMSQRIPDTVRAQIATDVDALLAAHELTRPQIKHWIVHTGGPKVLKAIEEALELPPRALERSWESLSAMGNVSATSVLLVLADLLDEQTAQDGDYGVLLAVGPGLSSESLLLRW